MVLSQVPLEEGLEAHELLPANEFLVLFLLLLSSLLPAAVKVVDKIADFLSALFRSPPLLLPQFGSKEGSSEGRVT